MTKGWYSESARHSLARKGVKTGRKTKQPFTTRSAAFINAKKHLPYWTYIKTCKICGKQFGTHDKTTNICADCLMKAEVMALTPTEKKKLQELKKGYKWDVVDIGSINPTSFKKLKKYQDEYNAFSYFEKTNNFVVVQTQEPTFDDAGYITGDLEEIAIGKIEKGIVYWLYYTIRGTTPKAQKIKKIYEGSPSLLMGELNRAGEK